MTCEMLKILKADALFLAYHFTALTACAFQVIADAFGSASEWIDAKRMKLDSA